MIVIRLPLKQSSDLGVSSKYGNKVGTCSKNRPGQVFFDDLMNMDNQFIYTFTYKKLILNVIYKNGK